MAEKFEDKDFLDFVVKSIVKKPEDVVTKRSVDEMGVLLELTVDKDDMGIVIGKEGKTAKALRALLKVLGAKNDARVNLKIVEPEGSERPYKKDEASASVHDEVKAEEPKVEEETVEETPAAEAPVEEEEDDDAPLADLDL